VGVGGVERDSTQLAKNGTKITDDKRTEKNLERKIECLDAIG